MFVLFLLKKNQGLKCKKQIKFLMVSNVSNIPILPSLFFFYARTLIIFIFNLFYISMLSSKDLKVYSKTRAKLTRYNVLS